MCIIHTNQLLSKLKLYFHTKIQPAIYKIYIYYHAIWPFGVVQLTIVICTTTKGDPYATPTTISWITKVICISNANIHKSRGRRNQQDYTKASSVLHKQKCRLSTSPRQKPSTKNKKIIAPITKYQFIQTQEKGCNNMHLRQNNL